MLSIKRVVSGLCKRLDNFAEISYKTTSYYKKNKQQTNTNKRGKKRQKRIDGRNS